MEVQTGEIEFAFSLAIFFLGMSAAFLGNFIEKNVKISSLVSMLFFSGGLLGSVVAIKAHSVPGLFLCYGGIMGIGLGTGYLSPVKTLMLWFKDHKGLATGIAISGFGLSKAILSPFIVWCNSEYSVITTLLVISGISIVSMGIAAILIKKPEYWKEEQGKISFAGWSIIKNPEYIKIWIIFYLNITCGLAIISFEKNICLTYGILAVGIISSMSAIFNTLGRFGYSSCSDLLKNKKVIYLIIFITSSLACISASIIPGIVVIIILLCIINAGYGGGFSTLPILLQSKFGMKNISEIHGLALSAWAWAGLSGNQLTNLIINRLGLSYNILLIILTGLYLISLGITMKIKRP